MVEEARLTGDQAPAAVTAAPAARSLVRHGALTFATTSAALGVNLVSGILIARLLGPSGRGGLTAIFAIYPIMAWLFEMGCNQAITFHQARYPEDAPKLISTWLVMLAPFCAVAIVVGELLVPHLLAAQSAEVVHLARLMMVSVLLAFFSDVMNAVLLGDHDFGFYNVLRLAQPLAVTLVYVALWVADALTLRAAVLTIFVCGIGGCVAGGVRVFRRHRLARPDWALGRRTLWYGLRAHGTATGGLITFRLDTMIIPAYLSAASVGFYAVATSVSWIVATIASSLGPLVLPVAVSRDRNGTRAVVHSLYVTLAVGAVLGILLIAVAGIAVRLVYGSSFLGSVEPMRLLVPGSVLYAAAGVLYSGLYALNRPFTAALSQIVGVTVTVTGLVLFLESGGIRAAAIVSSVAYTLVFVSALVLYQRAADVEWRELAPSGALFRAWWREASRLVVSRAS